MKPHKAVVFLCLLLGVALLIRCGSGGGNESGKKIIASGNPNDIVKGEALAVQYCQSCHELPNPFLLDKITWRKHVLPAMGLYLGINYHVSDSILNTLSGDMSYLAKESAIDSVQWQQIVNYYINKAPEHLPIAERTAPIQELPFFKVVPASAEWVSARALTSFVKIDDSVIPHRIIVADGMTNNLIVLNDKVATINSTTMEGAIVDMVFQKNNIVTTTIGADLWANNAKRGTIKQISLEKSGKVAVDETLIVDKLGRPLSTTVADLNLDGKPDYLVTQFGKMTGRLSWFEEQTGSYKEHLLRDKPGCVKVIIDTKNKTPNLWALFAQGDEGLFKYTNDGKGNFTEKRVLSFPPSYGSTYFDLVDVNGDGLKDVVYTCGDNGDYSQIPKPYHGVYVYLNTGEDTFENKYFYPMNGCYKAIVKDFDDDGKLDIAAISEYPGGVDRNQSFIYLKGKGGLSFQPYTLPPGTPLNNGITMDAGDIDGDGKTDLLIGNGYVDPGNTNKQPLFIVLTNIK